MERVQDELQRLRDRQELQRLADVWPQNLQSNVTMTSNAIPSTSYNAGALINAGGIR